jgi:hypothetical protein
LVHAEFKIIFNDPTIVGGCADNILWSDFMTADGSDRPDVLDLYIPVTGETADPLEIRTFTAGSTKPDCKQAVLFEYEQPFDREDEPAGWYEVPVSDELDLTNLNQAGGFVITWNPSQATFIDTLVPVFYGETEGYIPSHVDVNLRFTIFDATNVNVTADSDVVTIRVWGNNETKSD